MKSQLAAALVAALAGVQPAPAAPVPILYATNSLGHMESVAIWVAPDPAQSLLFITDKTGNRVELHDPIRNVMLSRFGTTGSGAGQLRYPNGIAVVRAHDFGNGIRDVVFVVERDNDRISMFELPGMIYRGAFGAGVLDSPYGIALHDTGARLEAWITSTGNDRVYVYEIVPSGANLGATSIRNFGVSATLESIVVDPVSQRALICDESGNEILVYSLTGTFVQRFGAGRFTAEPEGIVIYDLGSGTGYIIVSDQFATPTQYEVFDRQTYAWLGNFTGPTTTTDGIALTQMPLPNCPQGAFFAVNADDNVHCYRWNDIAAANGWQTRVEGGAPVPRLTVQAPNGGERWTVASQQNILWSSQDFGDAVRIEYSLDAGATWNLIAADAANSGTYAWTLPATPSGSCRVRVSDAADGIPSDASDANFTILGPAAILSLVSGNNQSALAGTTLATALAARVTDAAGSTLAGVPVLFEVTSGGGTVSGPQPRSTDANGLASCNWTLGPMPGPNRVTASTSGLAAIVFDATGTTVPPAPATVTFVETRSGSAAGATSVQTSAAVGLAVNDLYVVAVTSRPHRAINSVTGLGLSWTHVRTQCSGRGRTMVSVWTARGAPSGNGLVAATFASRADNAVIAVTRYRGGAAVNAVVSANTNGINGSCSGGTDGGSYSMVLGSVAGGSAVHVALGMRDRRHTPGSGFTERLDLRSGSGSSAAALAIEDRAYATQANATAAGSFNNTVDWAGIAIAIGPNPSLTTQEPAASATTPSRTAFLRGAPTPLRAGGTMTITLTGAPAGTLDVYDVAGRLVRRLTPHPGHAFTWDGRDTHGAPVAFGVYFIAPEASAAVTSLKVIVAR